MVTVAPGTASFVGEVVTVPFTGGVIVMAVLAHDEEHRASLVLG